MGELKFDMKKPCDTCPFKKGTDNYGAADWFIDVCNGIMRGELNHTCHKSDPKADGYKGAKEIQHCTGFLGMMKNSRMMLSSEVKNAIDSGLLDLTKIPTHGIYTLREFLTAYQYRYRSPMEVNNDNV